MCRGWNAPRDLDVFQHFRTFGMNEVAMTSLVRGPTASDSSKAIGARVARKKPSMCVKGRIPCLAMQRPLEQLRLPFDPRTTQMDLIYPALKLEEESPAAVLASLRDNPRLRRARY